MLRGVSWALLCLPLAGCATTTAVASKPRAVAPPTATQDDDDPDDASARHNTAPPLPAPSLGTLPSFRSADLPGGVTCLLRLRERGIAHRVLGPVGLIDTPIEVTGPIAGVTYRTTWRSRFYCDCRLALALERAGPFLRGVGITQAFFSSAYRRHTRAPKPPSRHSLGLAIDLHRFRAERGALLSVKTDYERGLDDACELGRWPQLNRLGCRLKRHGVFDVVLTPDSNADHSDHFHLAIWDLQRRHIPRRRRAHPVIRE